MYTEQQIWESFCVMYHEQNGTLDGVRDAYFWWKYPEAKCMIRENKKNGKRCKIQCEACRKRYGR